MSLLLLFGGGPPPGGPHPVTKITQMRYGLFGQRYGSFANKGGAAPTGSPWYYYAQLDDEQMIWMDVDTALAEVPVNIAPLIDDTDFKTVEDTIAYNAAGMDLRWNFVTTAGAYTSTAVTPTTAGDYDWAHQGDGMYSIEIPASGGVSINNDTEGFGWFSGRITGVLPFRGPTIGFRAAALNDLFTDSGLTLPGQVAPSNTPTLAEALGFIYKAWRNKKEQTSGTFKLYDDAGTTVDQKSTTSDDGTTFTAGEIGAGP